MSSTESYALTTRVVKRPAGHPSVLARVLDAIDDQHVDAFLLGIELQSELLLQGGEQRRALRAGHGGRGATLWRKRHVEVVQLREARAIDNAAPDREREDGGEQRQRAADEHEPSGAAGTGPALDGRRRAGRWRRRDLGSGCAGRAASSAGDGRAL